LGNWEIEGSLKSKDGHELRIGHLLFRHVENTFENSGNYTATSALSLCISRTINNWDRTAD